MNISRRIGGTIVIEVQQLSEDMIAVGAKSGSDS
jgi:hypothetical protein